jgi:hypothetical protein
MCREEYTHLDMAELVQNPKREMRCVKCKGLVKELKTAKVSQKKHFF